MVCRYVRRAFRESKVTSDELKDERIGHPITRNSSHFCVRAVHDKMTLRRASSAFRESKVTSDELKDERIGHPITRKQ